MKIQRLKKIFCFTVRVWILTRHLHKIHALKQKLELFWEVLPNE